MSELPKLHPVVESPETARLAAWPVAMPTPRTSMRESDFAGFTPEGRDVLARILRNVIERNGAVKP